MANIFIHISKNEDYCILIQISRIFAPNFPIHNKLYSITSDYVTASNRWQGIIQTNDDLV